MKIDGNLPIHEYMFLENCILFPRAAALVEEAIAS